MSRREIIIGTRGSDLALAQAHLVEAALKQAQPDILTHYEIIETTGDKRLDLSLSEAGKLSKGLFTKELDKALLGGRTHLSVHSLKDLPTERPDGVFLSAVLPRADWRDVLISRYSGGLQGLPEKAVIGTGSPRRAMQVGEKRPDLNFLPIRGNVPTRIRKLRESSDYDALVLAAAGLTRLGIMPEQERADLLNGLHFYFLEDILPAPGQAAIAIETKTDLLETVRPINDPPTMQNTGIERELLKLLGGGCQLALGALATCTDEQVCLKTIFSPNKNTPPRREEITFSIEEKNQALHHLAKTLLAYS
ncbi:MAG: hydroxymethylbilane synthase [Chthoniobacterales bacterium]